MTYSILMNSPVMNSSLSSRSIDSYRWEYKTVRSQKSAFRNPSVLKRLCENEAQAGWVLLEQLDDQRVRFKRAVNAETAADILNSLPSTPAIEPTPELKESAPKATWLQTAATTLAFTCAAVVPALVGYALMSQSLNHIAPAGSEQIHAN
jgi:hypothetical protein